MSLKILPSFLDPITRRVSNMRMRIWLRLNKVSWKGASPGLIGSNVLPSFTTNHEGSSIEFGSHCRFGGNVTINAWHGAKIRIGNFVGINDGSSLCAVRGLTIGNRCRIAPGVRIMDTSFHPVSPTEPVKCGAVTLGENVWLGTGVTVLPGVTIGDNTVVGAGSVVTRDLPANCLAVGNPARVVRELDYQEGWIRP